MYYIDPDNYFREDLDNREVIVSIKCFTYNHEKYIADALEGFVMQKTNFRFEAIVHDDASTDGTAAIIREYAEKYPSIIKPIFETENQYSKKDGSLRRIMNDHVRGRYVAYCEGDDYWTDPLKLQKQVDFLEANPDYSMCFHNAIEHWEDGKHKDNCFSNIECRDYSGLEIYQTWIVPTASVIINRSVLLSDIYLKSKNSNNFVFGDILIFLSAANEGRICGMSETMSVYRRHNGGVTYNPSIDKDKKIIKHQKEIVKVFGSMYQPIAKKHISCLYMNLRNKYIIKGQRFQALISLVKSLYYDLEPMKLILKGKLNGLSNRVK